MRFIPRSEWGARPAKSRSSMKGPHVGVVVHYTTGQELGRTDTAAWVRSIQNYHQNDRGWADIGYNFLVDIYGNIFEGRGWDVQGAHTGPWNSSYHGVAFLGNDDPDSTDATPQARRAIKFIVEEWERRQGKRAVLKGHRDQKPTACPGDELYAWVHAGMPVDTPAGPKGTPIIAGSHVTAVQAKRWAQSKGATATFEALADTYWELAPLRGGISPEVAYAQAAHETGFGHFKGAVSPGHRNLCGLKVRNPKGDNPEDFQRFGSWRIGVTAHLDHLALYAGGAGYPRTDTPDPRHFPSLKGKAPTVEGLTGTWATDPAYAKRVLAFVGELRSQPKENEDDMAIEAKLDEVLRLLRGNRHGADSNYGTGKDVLSLLIEKVGDKYEDGQKQIRRELKRLREEVERL